ncbi:MAG TPA: Calx-beta domain-containing protein, partial [Pseudomonadales bacterium]|nr:Calx-beta domain-containing protein [Pseudomonadales bacterium]
MKDSNNNHHDNDGFVARIIGVKGSVKLVSHVHGTKTGAKGDEIFLGDTLQTSADGAVVIAVKGGSAVSLGHNKLVTFNDQFVTYCRMGSLDSHAGDMLDFDTLGLGVKLAGAIGQVSPGKPSGDVGLQSHSSYISSIESPLYFSRDLLSPQAVQDFFTKPISPDPIHIRFNSGPQFERNDLRPSPVLDFFTKPIVPDVINIAPTVPPHVLPVLPTSIVGVAGINIPESGNLVYTVSLSHASTSATTFPLLIGGGTATDGVDFTNVLVDAMFSNGVTISGGIITVPAGVTSFTITVPTTPDTVHEPDETVPLTVGGVTGTSTIVDDDPVPQVASVTSQNATEAGTIVHAVTLTNASATAETFTLSLTDVSATGGVDYTNVLNNASFSNGVTINGGIITVPAGVTAFTISIPTTPDSVHETNETYTLTVGGVSGTGTINDDDPLPTISGVSSNSATEASAIVHTVSLSNASSTATTFPLSLADVSATGGGTDYNSTLTNAMFSNGVTISGGNITVPAGVTTFTISIPTSADTIDEPDETYTLTVGGVSGTGTILDDDPAPAIASVSSDSASESSNIVHTVTLTNVSSVSTVFALSLGDVTATGGGVDYTSTLTNAMFSDGVTFSGGNITVPAGVTSFTLSIPTTADTLDEPNETYTLTVGGVSGTGTINDDDPTPTLSVDDITINEAAGTATFTVSLSAASGQTVTVDYNTSNGTATSGSDYTSGAGTLTFAPGVTTQTITVPVSNDALLESSETFNVNLTTPLNATITDNLGVGTIVDNDTATAVLSVTTQGTETGPVDIVYTVTLSKVNNTGSSITFDLADL